MPRPADLKGRRFGSLVALKRNGTDKAGNALWLCQCNCGQTSVVRANSLLSGNTTTCGCGRGQPGGMLDLTGRVFGRLTVMSRGLSDSQGSCWYCDCSCGITDVLVSAHSLLSGNTRSCGCLRDEHTASLNRTHGMSDTRLYKVWKGMRQRCDNPNADAEERYYFQGITYASEWNDFENFHSWAQQHGYRDDLTLDRINPFKGYSPDNCRWISREAQAANTSLTYMRLVREAYLQLPVGCRVTYSILTFMREKYTDGFWSGIFGSMDFDLLDLDSVECLQYFLREYIGALYHIYLYQYCGLTQCASCPDSQGCTRSKDALDYLEQHQAIFNQEGWSLPVVFAEDFTSRITKE